MGAEAKAPTARQHSEVPGAPPVVERPIVAGRRHEQTPCLSTARTSSVKRPALSRPAHAERQVDHAAALDRGGERAHERGARLHPVQPGVANLDADDLAARGDAVELSFLESARR